MDRMLTDRVALVTGASSGIGAATASTLAAAGAAVTLVSAALPLMLDQGGGHIVNVGSVAGRRPFPGGTVYAATKFAVRALSAGIHRELSASRGIRVTDIEPGVVDTELPRSIEDPATREGFAARWEGKRMLTS